MLNFSVDDGTVDRIALCREVKDKNKGKELNEKKKELELSYKRAKIVKERSFKSY